MRIFEQLYFIKYPENHEILMHYLRIGQQKKTTRIVNQIKHFQFANYEN